jgi:three-Cys-motif partner protein
MQKFGARGHTGKKLEVLDKYHGFYPLALKDKWRLIYIDAFAGTGHVLLSEPDESAPTFPGLDLGRETLEGSATRALKASIPYHKYIFIEKSRKKLSNLRKELTSQFPQRISLCQFECADANEAIKKICATTDWKKHRAVVFLDPFGNQIEWSTLEALASTQAADIWYLFPAGLGIYRQIPKKGSVDEKAAESVTRILGSNDWTFLFTKRAVVRNIFDEEEETIQRNATVGEITEHAISRMKTIFRGGVLDDYVVLGGTDDVSWYSLLFAVSNPETKAKELAHKVAAWIVSHS